MKLQHQSMTGALPRCSFASVSAPVSRGDNLSDLSQNPQSIRVVTKLIRW